MFRFLIEIFLHPSITFFDLSSVWSIFHLLHLLLFVVLSGHMMFHQIFFLILLF